MYKTRRGRTAIEEAVPRVRHVISGCECEIEAVVIDAPRLALSH